MRQHVMSPFDAVDGSSTRHASAKDGGAANAPAISEELANANDYDNRSQYLQVGLSSAWRLCSLRRHAPTRQSTTRPWHASCTPCKEVKEIERVFIGCGPVAIEAIALARGPLRES